ncbi:MAG: type II toxin-antitoxin system VapC family toxin [Anaerolineales bacterium]|nr:type II toxin-antitoxin system VapC family toxin [Anaerolineales bacterium]
MAGAVVVVDASVWVSRLVTDDVFHTASRRWLAQHAQDGGQWVAPALMLAEVVGAISRRTGQPELAHRALKHLLKLPGLRLVALDRRLGKAAAQLAASAGLRGADAVYAALAQHLSIPLVTWDEEIGQRAGDLGTIIQPPREATP